VSSDKQLLMKKGKIKIPQRERLWIVDTMLKGIGCQYLAFINIWDTETAGVSEALRQWHPDMFFRGYDKKLETMPEDEKQVCEELRIEIKHAKNRIGERHSSEIF
jgi:hypothetical protein